MHSLWRMSYGVRAMKLRPQNSLTGRFVYISSSFNRPTIPSDDKGRIKELSPNPSKSRYSLNIDWKSFKDNWSRPAIVLGFAGLIPFMAPPVICIVMQQYSEVLALVQAAYGASILSFLGGMRWGLALPPHSPAPLSTPYLITSVIPSLIAWLSLLCPTPYSNFVVMMSLLILLYSDLRNVPYPGWMKTLRFCLTIGAVLSLYSMVMAYRMLSTPPPHLSIQHPPKHE